MVCFSLSVLISAINTEGSRDPKYHDQVVSTLINPVITLGYVLFSPYELSY